MLNPIDKLIRVKDTGKVKLMAASCTVPSILIKKVSTRLKVIRVIMPTSIGNVIATSVGLIGSCVKEVAVVINTQLFRHGAIVEKSTGTHYANLAVSAVNN